MDAKSTSRKTQKINNAVGRSVWSALRNEEVIEVLLNEDGSLWSERLSGEIERFGSMSSEDAMSLISTIAASIDQCATAVSPILECHIPGEPIRFESVIPPVVKEPVFAMRKLPSLMTSLIELERVGTLSGGVAECIRDAIFDRKNILISGGTGSGKTTLCSALLREIAECNPHHRIITIEDTPELNTPSENSVSLKVSPGATAQELLRATMRLRPDRIVVGEVRGGEALTLLKAWNTGHPGGVSTIHANSARGALTRVEQLVAEVSASPIPHVIADAIDLIVHLERSPLDGVRRVVEVVSVDGYSDGEYLINPIEE